jgi:hypothetical protein
LRRVLHSDGRIQWGNWAANRSAGSDFLADPAEQVRGGHFQKTGNGRYFQQLA